MAITGTLSKRIEKVKNICFNDEELKKVTTPEYYKDSKPENLDIEHWQPPLIKKQAIKQI